MPNFYVTYGYGSNLRHKYSKIEAKDYYEARVKVFDATGGKFAFIYDEEMFEGQVEKYNLKEVPLQPSNIGEEFDEE